MFSSIGKLPTHCLYCASCCQFLSAPHSPHLTVAKRILRCWKGTLEFGPSFLRFLSPLILCAYLDADWAGCPNSGHFTQVFVCFGVLILFLGVLRSNRLSPALLQRQSTALLLTHVPTLFGFPTYLMSFSFHHLGRSPCCMIISAPHTWPLIQFFMLVSNLLSLIITISSIFSGAHRVQFISSILSLLDSEIYRGVLNHLLNSYLISQINHSCRFI